MIKKYQGDTPIRTILVHEFIMDDVEDPEIYAAEPLYQWRQSAEGQWFARNATEDMLYNVYRDEESMGFRVTVTARLSGPALVEWLLRSDRVSIR